MSDRIHVLTAIYQSDRADRATNFTISLATMGAAVTYLIGTVAFYDKLDLLHWAIALLPLPLLCIAAFHALLLNLAAIRAHSILILEEALLTTTRTTDTHDVDHTHIGTSATERATNIHTAPRVVTVATLIAYGGIGLIYPLYTGLMLVKATRHLHTWIILPSTVYLALLAAITLMWRRSINNLKIST
ncbi:hypothetical protein B0I31_1213 [Saccharothrix carnea]|uniref:Uncharacterized protein n=1 Tax=Saccharothrix carnea TaxID=1280637 RepID=A0A2P8HYY5_SACCR|nr:hypothetical protein [Saccharothrix carnea]PSL51374.1 hypothetical protein B0I31_1213 [Saccharothrix carnea]